MASAFKRTKAATTSGKTSTSDSVADSSNMSAPLNPFAFIPFHTGPSLEHIPDDVLHEILSHIPALHERHVQWGGNDYQLPMIPSAQVIRLPTLRALSQTSRILRSRCLAMAWQSVELCGAGKLPKSETRFSKTIGEATRTTIRILTECPYLLPLISTVTIIITYYKHTEIIPSLAACLAMLPNLISIQVLRVDAGITTELRKAFAEERFPSVRKIVLPSTARAIAQSCPNLEEVICTYAGGNDSKIIGCLVKGKCRQVRVLKGISAPLTRLIRLCPNMKHICVQCKEDMTLLAKFPLLDTIEISIGWHADENLSIIEFADSDIKNAIKILKENMSKAEKTVIVTEWKELDLEENTGYLKREVIRV